ncbi:MAG: anhydro-N-acetylmuramic acid kinase [Elusimicrobiaceae bacterium]|nr:anhydro-N-acetylmuramic acid kinase [Elusimicrobiaceae bacterium]
MSNLFLGLMSGTSADGLTLAILDVKAKKIICFKNYNYPKILQKEILQAPSFDTAKLAELNFKLGKIYLSLTQKFLKDFKINKKDISAIGLHGQTVYHNGKIPCTLQIGEAAFLAKNLGIPVINNFRPSAIALGGQGAPLVPIFEDYFLADKNPKILLNIGGISNASYVQKNKTFGFDLGPGNVLSDYAISQLSKGKKSFDSNGKFAAANKPDIKKAKEIAKNFLYKKIISLDRSVFTKPFFEKYFSHLTQKDLATLNYLTALIITQNIKKFILKKYNVKELLISGGGIYNKTLINNLKNLLPELKIKILDTIDPMAKEAACFAYLAYLALHKIPVNKNLLGTKKDTVLGVLNLI